jgi:hypothetical protein
MSVPIRRGPLHWLCVLGLATAVTTLPLSALAAEAPDPPPISAPLHLSTLARQAAAALPPPALCSSDGRAQAFWGAPAQAQASAQAPAKSVGPKPGTWSFFKTPAGIAVLATVAVGLGYTLYSMQHDQASSPGQP